MIRLLLTDIRRTLGWRAGLLGGAMIANGLAEGVGLLLLFPLLSKLGVGSTAGTGGLADAVDRALAWLAIPPDLPVLLAVIVAAFLFQNAVFLAQSRLAAEYQNRYTAIWRRKLFEAFMRARWRFFTEQKAGDLINALVNETNRLTSAFFTSVQLAAGLVFVIVYLGLAIASAWQVAAALAAFGVVMYVVTGPRTRAGRAIGIEFSQYNEEMVNRASEFIGGAKLLKSSAREGHAIDLFASTVTQLFRLGRWASFQPNLLRSIYEMVGICVLCATIWAALVLFGTGPANILIAVYLSVRLYARMSILQSYLQTIHIQVPAVAVLQRLHDQAAAATESEPGAAEPAPAFGERGAHVEIEDLVVRYRDYPVLHGVSLDLPAGATVAVVGGSGAGKSTLVDCLMELVTPASGTIRVDGVPLDEISLKHWRRAVGYVAQDTFLFNTSIRENLRWGNEGVTDAELVAAARLANAHGFISQLPEGYDTPVGDRGVRLSGGQRQRLGLARALIGPRALLILDEPTSALDSDSEAVVMEAIAALHGRITTVIVAHRLSTIRNADLIYVLENGRVIESGSWHELVARGARFDAMWRMQSAQRS